MCSLSLFIFYLIVKMIDIVGWREMANTKVKKMTLVKKYHYSWHFNLRHETSQQDTRLASLELGRIRFNSHLSHRTCGRPRLDQSQGGVGRLLGLRGEVWREPFLQLIDLLDLVLRVLWAGAGVGGARPGGRRGEGGRGEADVGQRSVILESKKVNIYYKYDSVKINIWL